MIIFPAIDLRGGQVVRLRQGDPAAQTVFGDDPAETARRWAAAGAEWLHVVNLDGAFGAAGEAPINLRRLAEIRAATPLPIQFGGGVRSVDDAARALDLGATRVVFGTAAVREPAIVEAALRRFGPEAVVVGIDARDGFVTVAGWQETSGVTALQLAISMRDLGVRRAVYTDVARDGMLAGVNVAATAALAAASGLRVIASGGAAGLADIHALAQHAAAGIEGVIIGQALYSGAIDLAEAIAAAAAAPQATTGPAIAPERGQPC
jgi:phosphoribosylformimino-5-aminoimidazole carboxamide ribotide isomerase